MGKVGLTRRFKLPLTLPIVLLHSVIGKMNTVQLCPQAQRNSRTAWKTP